MLNNLQNKNSGNSLINLHGFSKNRFLFLHPNSIFMKRTTFAIAFLFVSFAATSQGQASLNTTATTSTQQPVKVPALDKSPMDMSYFPADYPILKTQNKATTPPVARVLYSRPQKVNRVIFGNLVEYNKLWRLGANEATEIEFFKDVTIAGKKVPKGRYTLYAIPTEAQWTIILNRDTDTWGAFVYDEKKDVLRTDVPVKTLPVPVDAFSINFNKTGKGMDLFIAWDNVSVSLPITVSGEKSNEKATPGKERL
jgi:hypothetical protein